MISFFFVFQLKEDITEIGMYNTRLLMVMVMTPLNDNSLKSHHLVSRHCNLNVSFKIMFPNLFFGDILEVNSSFLRFPKKTPIFQAFVYVSRKILPPSLNSLVIK